MPFVILSKAKYLIFRDFEIFFLQIMSKVFVYM